MTVLETCPDCENLTEQKHIHTQPNQRFVETVGGEKLVLWSACFVMVCERCRGIILYQTPDWESDAPQATDDDWDDEGGRYEENILRLAFIDKNPEFVPQIVWPRLRLSETWESKITLDTSVPQAVRECVELGTKVRPFSQDLYALQLRKALEAICKDLGADELLSQSWKKATLFEQIDQLKKNDTVSTFISSAAHKLKDLSNTGAHYSEVPVSAEDIRKLEVPIKLIVTYVYETKHKRSTIEVEGNVH